MQFADLMRNMSGRFDRQQLQERAQLQFNNLYQPAGQSLVEWANTVSAVGAEAFRGLPEGYAQSQIVHRFGHGSADKDAGYQVSLSRPVSLDEAIERMRWHAHHKNAIFGSRCASNTRLHAQPQKELKTKLVQQLWRKTKARNSSVRQVFRPTPVKAW
ncbi:hypothetical protein ElyMa_001303500 [Elysia marginata]|uniref:Uncharacterized protein n=1 Tax=Elysia marginata TaxID=1093978 RepID=A0AAV4IMC9_9GAST|nr:hypothetical protein ElyMa_001303500 [Elysia marginata]